MIEKLFDIDLCSCRQGRILVWNADDHCGTMCFGNVMIGDPGGMDDQPSEHDPSK